MTQIKLIANGYKYPVEMYQEGDRYFFKFGYNKSILAVVKQMQDAKWHGFDDKPRKLWSIPITPRNLFQLSFMMGQNPYAIFDKPLTEVKTTRKLYEHQLEMIRHALTRRMCIFACEMGTGKTLAAIEVMEKSGYNDWWWVGPKSALAAVMLEFSKWKSKVYPKMFTYNGLKSTLENYTGPAPHGVVFDESSKIKTPSAQRSQYAMHLANSIRKEHDGNGYIILMSGTPAPKAPTDWWNQCLTSDTWILTADGPKQIIDLVGKPFEAHVNGRNYPSTGFIFTGNRKVFELTTVEGYSLKATGNHKIFTSKGWKELKDLTKFDLLVINKSDAVWGGRGTKDEGYLLGHIYGDGSVYEKEGKHYGCIQLYDDAQASYFASIFGNQKYVNNRYTFQNATLNDIVRRFKVTPDKEIFPLIEQSSSEFLSGFLSGLFDTDGTVEKSRLRIGFSQTDYIRISTVQRLLNYFGIKSQLRLRLGRQSQIDGRTINSQPFNYILFITGENAVKFAKRVGFRHPTKKAILEERIKYRHNWPSTEYASVREIRLIGVEDVYDAEVDIVHAFSANGIIVHNCEVCCPGFFKEGDIQKFRSSLAVIEEMESLTGGVFPKLVGWYDDEKKCKKCLQLREHENHDTIFGRNPHEFIASTNEVHRLYTRMRGLVLVKFKKDCLDLPEKQYRKIYCPASKELERTSQFIKNTTSRAVQALTLLRELSDGFQYVDTVVGTETCKVCGGKKIIVQQQEELVCDGCNGNGEVKKYRQEIQEVVSPKDAILKDLLDEHEDAGRIVIYAGFTGSVEKCIKVCRSMGWEVLRLDGRGWYTTIESDSAEELLKAFDLTHPEFKQYLSKIPKLAFIGQPGAGGMGLTLTASPSVVYFSNDFNGTNRMQSEDRIHRPGMDTNKGATIIDIINLPTDELVLANLQKKKDLQNLTMGEVMEALENANSTRTSQ